MKRISIILMLIIILVATPVFNSCNTAKQIVVDNKELIKQVLVEIIDQIIDLIDKTPNANVSKSVLRMSPDYHYITVDIVDDDGSIIKSVQYDILKRYQDLEGR